MVQNNTLAPVGFFLITKYIHGPRTMYLQYCQLVDLEHGNTDILIQICNFHAGVRAHTALKMSQEARCQNCGRGTLSRGYLEAVSHAVLARRRGMRFRNRQARYDKASHLRNRI